VIRLHKGVLILVGVDMLVFDELELLADYFIEE